MNRTVISYRDEMLHDFDKTGTVILYRNPTEWELDENGTPISNRQKYSTHPQPGEPGLYDQTPVAIGFTAFADAYPLYTGYSVRMLLEKGKRPNSLELFGIYLEKALKQPRNHNDGELRPLAGKTLLFKLYSDHCIVEKRYLQLSNNYYTEFIGDNDRNIKSKIKEYADRYLEWLQEEIDNIPEQNTEAVHDKLREAKNQKESTSKIPNNETVAAHALYCYYLQDKDHRYMDPFEKNPGGKMKGFEAYVEGKNISIKSFQLSYNSMCKADRRLTRSNIKNIDMAIQMMGEVYPKAVKLAQKELDIIELKNK